MKGHWKIPIIAVISIAVIGLSFGSIYAVQQYEIPAWVKGVAGFWAEDRISDVEFGQGLSYLINNDIIKVPEMKSLEQKISLLETENKNLRGDVEFLEKENVELRTELRTPITTPSPKTVPIVIPRSQYSIIDTMLNVGEVKFYFNDLPNYSKDELKNAINEVTDLLKTQSNSNVKFTVVDDKSKANVIIAWIKDFGGHRLGEAYPTYLNVGVGQTDCMREWMHFDQQTLTHIIMHEIGHSLGFRHSTDATNVMYEGGTASRFYQYWDAVDYFDWSIFGNQGHGDVVQLCKGEYLIEVISDKPVKVELYNHLPVSTFEFEGRTIQDYMSCKEFDTTNYKRTCIVEKSATLNVWFFEEEVVETKIKIERLDKVPKRNMVWDKNFYHYPDIYSLFFN